MRRPGEHPTIWGICNVCNEPVTYSERDERSHPCQNFYVDYSPEAIANPKNEPWKPGYRFYLQQSSQRVGRHNVHRRIREYTVHFKINLEGSLEWCGGIRATEATQRIAETLYQRNRPGSNWYPSADDN